MSGRMSGRMSGQMSGRISGRMSGVFKKKIWTIFFRFFGTNGHPIAAVKLSLSDVATNFRSAIDLWRSQGRFIGLNEENENFQKNQFFQKKKILKSILGAMPSLGDLQGVSKTGFL